VDRTLVPASGQTLVWDTQVPGFALRVRAGGKRTYCYKYRVSGRQRWMTLGEHGVHLTAEQARAKALAAATHVNAHADPQFAKETARGALFVDQLAALYLDEGKAAKPDKRESSWSTDKSRLNRHVLPLIGKMRAQDLTRADIERMQAKIAAGGTAADVRTGARGRAIVTGGPLVASGCVTTLSAMLSWGVLQGHLQTNAAKGIRKVQPDRREQFLSLKQARALLATLTKLAEARTIPPAHAAILRLLLYTGARKSEILGLSWGEVDFEHRQIRLPRSRAKAGVRTILLNDLAVAELARQPQTGPFVFPSLKKGREGHTIGLHKTWRTVRKAAGIEAFRIHDLRHSFASFAAGMGEPLQVIGKALGHADPQTTQIYAHLTDDPVRRLTKKIASKLSP